MSIPPQFQQAPAVLADGGQIQSRVTELRTALAQHFERLRRLDRYSRRVKTNWFPKSSISAPSVMRSTIRAAERTAIAYLAGGTPTWRVASYGGMAGLAQRDEPSGARDAKFERIARAIFHHIDRQSEVNLLYEPVRRAVREGEIIIQYGWLPEAQRLVQGPQMAPLAPTVAPPGEAMGVPSSMPEAPPPAPNGLDLMTESPRHRFPLAVRVLSRTRVFYELDHFGEPVEVYHSFTARASEIATAYPEWARTSIKTPHEPVRVIEAWVGGWMAVVVDDLVLPGYPRRHLYGERPPFVIERCAPEETLGIDHQELVADVVAGTPFCMDMLEAFEEACASSSLKRMILENTAIGSYAIENAAPERFSPSTTGEGGDQLVLGPGTLHPLHPNEKLAPVAPAPLPPAVAAHLEEAENDMAALSFSPAFLRGDAQGDPSGYALEQFRQSAMARLMPYRDALDRALSRLFERIFQILSTHWAPEWGEELTLFGQREGEFFREVVTPDDLVPPPQHVEVSLMPALPQNKIAERQANIAAWQAGTADILSIMEEEGVADPQEEYENVILHKFELENELAQAQAVLRIMQKRAARSGQPLPPVGQMMAAQMGMPPGPPGPGGMPPGGPGGPPPGQRPAPPGAPRPNAQPPGPGMMTPPAGPAISGPAPRQRPGLSPLGVAGAPNPPVPVQTKKRRPGGR